MFRLMTLDQSITQTGVAIYDGGPAHKIECLSFSCKDEKDWLAKVSLFGRSMRRLISIYRPAFILYEKPLLHIEAYGRKPKKDLAGVAGMEASSVNANQLLLPAITGEIIMAGIAYSIPTDWVAPATWRKVYAGMDKSENKKEQARTYCRLNHIAFANHNEAEAAAIAIWGYGNCQTFKLLRYERELEAAQ